MNFTIYYANNKNDKNNVYYKNKVIVTNSESMESVVEFDHVGATYKDNRRSVDNFIESDVIIMDSDNDHSENPDDWITPKKLRDKIPDVPFIAVSSKSNMKTKGNFSARPRHHFYFPTAKLITDSTEYSNLKRRLQTKFPFFDKNALDSARFIFASENPTIELFEGTTMIDVALQENQITPYGIDPTEDFESILKDFENERSCIPEGERNNTVFNKAISAFKRYGDTQQAHDLIQEAVQRCSPPLSESEVKKIKSSALKYHEKDVQRGDYIPSEKYNKPKESREKLIPSDFSDTAQAEIFVEHNKDKMLFSYATGYMFFNGAYWEDGKIHAQRLVHELTKQQLNEVNLAINSLYKKIASCGDEKQKEQLKNCLDKAKKLKSFIIGCRNTGRVKATLHESIPYLSVDVNQLDGDPYLLNMPSGTYNLKTSELQPHCSTDYITKQTTVDLSDDGIDIWLKCLQTIFQNNTELINYFQEILGLILIGEVKVESLIICQGDGSNGKTTLWNVISRVLGDYCGTISADTLTVNCRRNIKPELAELQGKRLVIAPELEEGVRLSTSTLKHLCSRDKITAEKKFKDPFSFKPSHQIVLYTNPLPNVGSIDEGTWRRIILIPFNVRFSGNNEIKNYEEYLFNNAGGAVLKWMVEGAKKCIENDFKLQRPGIVTNAIKNYREDTDWLAQFIDEYCEVGENLSTPSREFYKAYCEYCFSTGEFKRQQKDFIAALRLKGFDRKKTSTCNRIMGIGLKPDRFF